MVSLKNIEKKLNEIEQRNTRVEIDKAWETSYSRRGLLIVFTYLAIALYLYAIGVENFWIHAIVPAIGFLLSTLMLPFFKKLWINIYKK